MKKLIFSAVLFCMARNPSTIASSSVSDSCNRPSIDCLKYKNDEEILASFPFHVDLDLYSRSFAKTSGTLNGYRHVYLLNIINENFVPLETFCLIHLQQLYIRHTSFSKTNHQIPAEIDRLASTLLSLNIHHTRIDHLPEQISRLKYLHSLELVNTSLMSLPHYITRLHSLIFLSLSDNQLTSLPNKIKRLSALSQLILNNNRYLHSIQQINGLQKLQGLQASSCQINELPLNLPSLTDLYMSKNNLSHLTGILTLGYRSARKKRFYFNDNHIESITSQIGDINNLHTLNLDNNHLKTLPLDLFNVSTLDSLYIRNNSFSSNELKSIVDKFKVNNPLMHLY